MSSTSYFQLPLPVLGLATTLTGLGLYMTVFRRVPWSSQTSSPPPTSPVARRLGDTTYALGILTTAVGLSYFLTSYVPIEKNQWLHATVPLRMFLGTVFLGRLVLSRKEELTEEGYWECLTLGLIDFFSAVALGLYLGRFDGKVD